MSELLKKMQAAYDRLKREGVAGIPGSTRYVPGKDDEDDENPDSRPDFPYVTDPKGFVTHVPMEAEADNIREQGEEEEAPPEEAPEAPPEGGEEMPEGGEMPPEGGEMPMDPNDPAAGGMPGMPPGQEPLSSSQIGRMYELKKIYSRLASVESFLSRTTDQRMLEVRKLVGKSINLFELVISNFPQYKDKVDEIIVTYYEFLDSVYGSLKKYFAEMSKEQKNDRT